MRIYALTQLGKRLARSTHNPDTPAWRIVHFLDNNGHGTPDQIGSYVGLDTGEASSILGALRRKGIVSEVSSSNSHEEW